MRWVGMTLYTMIYHTRSPQCESITWQCYGSPWLATYRFSSINTDRFILSSKERDQEVCTYMTLGPEQLIFSMTQDFTVASLHNAGSRATDSSPWSKVSLLRPYVRKSPVITNDFKSECLWNHIYFTEIVYWPTLKELVVLSPRMKQLNHQNKEVDSATRIFNWSSILIPTVSEGLFLRTSITSSLCVNTRSPNKIAKIK